MVYIIYGIYNTPVFIFPTKINRVFLWKKIFGLFPKNHFPAETLKILFFFFSSQRELNIVPGEKNSLLWIGWDSS